MKKNTALVVRGGVIAALYAGLTLISSALGLSFGPIQFRFSEALCVLPVFFPEAIPALTIGCFISNLASPFGLADIVFGTAATLLSCLVSAWFKNVKVFKLPPFVPAFPRNFQCADRRRRDSSAIGRVGAFIFHLCARSRRRSTWSHGSFGRSALFLA